MRYTLLELVQRILESADSDEVNSITDTAEALTVANIIKECYFEILGEIEPIESDGLFHLDASGDNTKPTVMYLPSSVVNIEWLRYNVGESLLDTEFRDLDYLPIEDFLRIQEALNYDETYVESQIIEINGQEFNVKYRNDEDPRYWTSPDGQTILLDSYDSSYEDTLTSSRTYGFGQLVPVFQMTDTFVPRLNPKQFQLLLQEAKAQAFIELKQTANEKAERKAKRNRILAMKNKDSSVDPRPNLIKHGGFGRRGGPTSLLKKYGKYST